MHAQQNDSLNIEVKKDSIQNKRAVKKAIYVAAEWFCARISHYLICVSPLDLSCAKRYHINSKNNRVYIPHCNTNILCKSKIIIKATGI